jgi:hypothetical protein
MNRSPSEAQAKFPFVTVSGTPFQLGFQQGQLLREGIRGLRRAFYREIVYSKGPFHGIGFQAATTPLLLAMHRYIPGELRAEMRGVAAGAGVPYWDILTLNCFDDLIHGLWLIPKLAGKLPLANRFAFACSSFALLGERTRDGQVLHGRNLDYEIHGSLAAEGVVTRVLRESLVAVEYRPAQGQRFISIGWPGVIGVVTSLNEASLSLACLTSSIDGETPNGLPLPLLYRQISQHARSLAEAEQMIRAAKRTIGNNLLVASGRENDARVFELAPRDVAVRQAVDGILTTTNHFQHDTMAEHQNGWVIPNSLDRYQRLQTLCSSSGCGIDEAESFLRDTVSLAADENVWSCLENPGTIYSTVAEPVRGRLWVRVNDQPERSFSEISGSWVAQPVAAAV